MLLRSVPRHKLLVVLLLLFTSAFLVRETIFSRSIQQLVEEASNEGGKNESESIKSTITATATTTALPWILPSRQVRLWMDIPNAFPWRHCIEEYNNIVTLLSCYKVSRYYI